jgi:hypothetical protein
MKEYIERAKLMDHIEFNAREHEADYDAWQILGDVEDFPAADVVERKRGEWIKRPDERICPFCNDRHSYFGGAEKKFCSECGADMRQSEVEHDPN